MMGKKDDKECLFTEDELQTIASAVMLYDNDRGATRDDVAAVFSWCEGARIAGWLLELVLQRKLSVRVVDGVPKFRMLPTSKPKPDP